MPDVISIFLPSVHQVLVAFEALLFGLFTMCMLCDQQPVLASGETKIARLKGGGLGAVTKINEVFGAGSFIRRLFPLPVLFPTSTRADILGYVPSAEFCVDDDNFDDGGTGVSIERNAVLAEDDGTGVFGSQGDEIVDSFLVQNETGSSGSECSDDDTRKPNQASEFSLSNDRPRPPRISNRHKSSQWAPGGSSMQMAQKPR